MITPASQATLTSILEGGMETPLLGFSPLFTRSHQLAVDSHPQVKWPLRIIHFLKNLC